MKTKNNDIIKEFEEIQELKIEFKYPDNFNVSVDGANIYEEEINKWIENGLKHFKKEIKKGNINSTYFYTLSGNSLVIMTMHEKTIKVVLLILL